MWMSVQAGVGQQAQAATSRSNLIENMNSLSNGHFRIVWAKNKETPTFVSGTLSDNPIHNLEEVKEFLKKEFMLFKMAPESDLTFINKTKNNLGMSHYHFIQSVRGIPVEGATLTIHTGKDGIVKAVSDRVYPNVGDDLENDLTPILSKSEAINLAWDYIQTNDVQWICPFMGSPHLNENHYRKDINEKVELVVYPFRGTNYLAYHVELQFMHPNPGKWQIYINTNDGSLINAYNAIAYAGSALSSGYGVLGEYHEFQTYFSNGYYYLYDTTKPMNGVIETYTARNRTNLPGVHVFDGDNAFTAVNQGAAVSAHYNTEVVYNYFYNVHGRNSFDNQGSTVRSTVHYGTNYNNVFWNGDQIVYGDGDGKNFIPFSGALDVVAHEFTHAVIDYSAQLEYHDQPGALNESMSDVFGVFVENDGFLLGEDVITPGISGDAMRSIANPPAFGQPEHMENYVHTSKDNGGIHINSGIPNKAAYLTIKQIGMEKAEKIYYRALTVYLEPASHFIDAKAALLQSTADYYGYGNEYKAVIEAWNQVGIY